MTQRAVTINDADGKLYYDNSGTPVLITSLQLKKMLGTDHTVDIRDFLSSGYTQYTTAHTGTDIGPAINDAADYLRSNYGRGLIIIPPGKWRVETIPDYTKTDGIRIWGLGSQASLLIIDADSGSFYRAGGSGGYTGGGIGDVGILLDEGHASSTITAIDIRGDSSYQPGQIQGGDLYITVLGTSKWYNGFVVDGSAKTSPQGARGGRFGLVEVFGCSNRGAILKNAVEFDFDLLGTNSGTGQGNDIEITGGGSALTNTIGLRIMGGGCNGDLILNNCSQVYYNGKCANRTFSSSATEVILDGEFSGSTTGSLGANSIDRMLGTGTPFSVTGGTITTPGDGYKYHTFTSNGSLVVTGSGNVDALVIGGGGGGGGCVSGGVIGGGGAGGGIQRNTSYAVADQTISVTVGAKGNGGASSSSSTGDGTSGGNSVFGSITANGGGGGGHANVAGAGGNGATGGSGGGGGYGTSAGTGGSGTSGQGNAGATQAGGGNAGGGGGAGGAASGTTAGAGASYFGTTYAAGAAGNATGKTSTVQPAARSANTGDGGWGGWNAAGADGGSGKVIIRYPI